MVTTASRHDPAWLEEVRLPGPNGVTFWKQGEVVSGVPQSLVSRVLRKGRVTALAGNNLMEDDVTTSQFTSGCAAYAGYSAGSFSNMTAVRAYTNSQHARSFAYSGFLSQLAGANAIDMEPGLAPTSDAAPAYHAGIRYFYTSASSVSAVNSNLAGAGISRSSYKIISAHYSGEHICGPSTCGYPQADATQFTDAYLGRSLDCTVFDAAFWGTPPPPPPPPPPAPFYGKPRNLSANVVIPPTKDYVLTWSVPAPVAGVPAPTAYQVYVYDGVADRVHLFQKEATVTTTKIGVNGLKHGHTYIVHIVAAGNTKYIGADIFATLTIKP
jgi:hypothetical protein